MSPRPYKIEYRSYHDAEELLKYAAHDKEEVDRRDADEKRKDREEKITYILLA